jgi:hypothetical protein
VIEDKILSPVEFLPLQLVFLVDGARSHLLRALRTDDLEESRSALKKVDETLLFIQEAVSNVLTETVEVGQ